MTMQTTAPEPATAGTARDLLFGAGIHPLAEALAAGGVIRAMGGLPSRLSGPARRAAADEIASAAAASTEIDLARVLAAGWRKHAALRAAAARTLADPGAIEVVDLATHRISSVHRPGVDVLVDGVRVASIELELRLELVVHALVATVREGGLVSLQGGRCVVEGTLTWGQVQLARQRTEVDLALTLALRDGIPLVRGREAPDRTPAG